MKLTKNYVLSLTIIIILTISTNPVGGEVIWSDDFNDEDMDGWRPLMMVFDWDAGTAIEQEEDMFVEDGVLTSAMNEKNATTYWNFVYHDTSVKYGKWSFDLAPAVDDDEVGVRFAFVTNDSENMDDYYDPISHLRTNVPLWGMMLIIHIEPSNPYTTLVGFDGVYFDHQIDYFSTGELQPSQNGWRHFEITWQENNTVKVHQNETLIITENLEIDYFRDFVPTSLAIISGYGARWDNILVEDWTETTTEGVPWELYIIGSSMAIGILVYSYLRGKKN